MKILFQIPSAPALHEELHGLGASQEPGQELSVLPVASREGPQLVDAELRYHLSLGQGVREDGVLQETLHGRFGYAA
ncbi:MAG: hypothetical protein ACYSU0_10745 [Planctomycetota bacterium]